MGNSTNIFNLTHMVEQVTNENIVRFTKDFSYPIGISTIMVLGKVEARGPVKHIELSEALGYSKSTITKMAEKLVKLELVKRIYDKNDRRTIHLEITSKGTEALKEARLLGDKIYKELYSVLSEEELASYIAIQEKLSTHISDNRRLSF